MCVVGLSQILAVTFFCGRCDSLGEWSEWAWTCGRKGERREQRHMRERELPRGRECQRLADCILRIYFCVLVHCGMSTNPMSQSPGVRGRENESRVHLMGEELIPTTFCSPTAAGDNLLQPWIYYCRVQHVITKQAVWTQQDLGNNNQGHE